MINKQTLDNLKYFKIQEDNLLHVTKAFPLLLSNTIRSMYIYFKLDTYTNISATYEQHLKLQTKLSYFILLHQYDNFDNVLLEYLDSVHYGIHPYIYKIEFNKEERQKFINVCNQFAGKHWNDILDPFLDALYNLLATASVDDVERLHKLPLNLN